MMMTMTTGAKPPHRRPLALLALLLSIATCHSSSSSVDYYSTAVEEFEPEVVPGSARFRFLQSNANTCNVKELLVNGDIETGTLEGWQRWGDGNGHVIEITEGYRELHIVLLYYGSSVPPVSLIRDSTLFST